MRLLKDELQNLGAKRVLVRCNFDVPIDWKQERGVVLDATRIEDSGETLRKLLDYGAKLVLLSHYDRPNGKEKYKSLKPVVPVLERMLGETVAFSENLDGKIIEQLVARIVLIENLRFWQGEYDDDENFVKKLAGLGDFYVNEAFANCHRKHASMVGLPKKMPAMAGFHLASEVKIMRQVRENPEKPLVMVLGGAKLETKEPLVRAFIQKADRILVGGKIASDIKKQSMVFPENVLVADSISGGKDIDEKSAKMFAEEIMKAKTVIWNGTLGVFEDKRFRKGTQIVAEAVNKTTAFTVVGGGDTEAALTVLDLESGIDHVSTGGGAMLKFLADGKLPAIEALN